MTVSTSTNSVVYRGNGATTQFAVPFKVLDEDHLRVRRRVFATGAIDYTYIGTDHSYSGIGAPSGTLTLAGTALDDDYELVIERIVPYTQDLDIVNAGGFYPETVEEQLDLMTMGVQQLAALVGRGAVVPVGETGLELTKVSDRANMFFAFDALGRFVASSGTGADAGLRTDMAETSGSSLLGFIQAGFGAVENDVETKLRQIMDIEDFGGGTGVADNVTAIRAALTRLGVLGGGTLQFQAGTYNLASATLGVTGIEIPADVTIRGSGKGATRLVVTGVAECWFFLNEDNSSNHLICDLTARGNSVANSNGPGGFYYCSVLNGAATASVRNCRLRNVRLENFKGDFWVRFYCTSTDLNFTIDDCGIDWGCDVLTYSGNARNPALLGVSSGIVEFRGALGQVNDCFVNGLAGELSWVKSGIAAFGAVNRLKIRSPSLRNTFQGHGTSDVGAYAIVLYDEDGVVTGTSIENATIINPFSCGIYTAHSNNTLITAPHIYGQEDTGDATLPKAAIALNGAVNWKIVNPDLHDNYIDIAIVGSHVDVAGFAFPADVNGTVIGGSGLGAGFASVKITASASKPLTGGIRFIGYRGLDATDSGVAFYVTTARALENIEFIDCEMSGDSYGYNFNRGGAASHGSTGIVVSGGRAHGGLWSIRGLNFNAGGSVTINDVAFYGTPTQHHIQFETMDTLSITDNRFYGVPGAAENMYLEACKGMLRDNVAFNGSVMVENTAAALGVDAPAWAGYPGVYVQNTVPGLTGATPNAYRLLGWEWLTGTTWTEIRSGLV